MPTIFVFNNQTGYVERYYRGLLEPMPYIWGRTMTVGEFKAKSNSEILWTDLRMLNSWNYFRNGWGRPIFIGYAFKRIWEGGHSPMSQHYAGVALDIGQTLLVAERNALRQYAVNSGVWTYVDSVAATPTWVHVDDRTGMPACASGGYPTLALGSRGVYVFVLQDALTALGYTTSGLDGYFGYGTRAAVINYQIQQGLIADGIVGCITWTRLTNQVNGMGITPTVIRR